MTYNGTHFNDAEVLTHTRKQWLRIGGRGNGFTEAQLGEVYDLLDSTRPEKLKVGNYANSGKPPKSLTADKY